MASKKSAPSVPTLVRSKTNLQLQSGNGLWTMERGSKSVSTHENEITQQQQLQHHKLGARYVSGLQKLTMGGTSTGTEEVNGRAEQNVGVMVPTRNETSLFGVRVRLPGSSSQQPLKENGIARQSIGARSPTRTGSSGVITGQTEQPPQQSMTQVDAVNSGHIVSGELDEATGSRKQAMLRTLGAEYGINREILEQHSGKKLKDVADSLGVSRSTLKRICRKHHIFRWPPSKARRHNDWELGQFSGRSTEESSDLPPEIVAASHTQTTPEMQGDNSIMVKATFKDDIIKFQLSLASRKSDLEKEVSMRLNLSIGSYKIKYLDEDGDWVLIACDADLRNCTRTLASLGKKTIRMLIDQLPSDNPRPR